MPSSWPISQVCSLGLDPLKGFWIFHCICLGLLMVPVTSVLLGFWRLVHGPMKVLPALVSPLGCPPLWSNPILATNTLNVHLKVYDQFTTLSTMDLDPFFRITCMWKNPWIKFKCNAQTRDSAIAHSKWLLWLQSSQCTFPLDLLYLDYFFSNGLILSTYLQSFSWKDLWVNKL